MAQNDIQITTTPPLSGLTLVENVNDAFQSLATDFAGAIDPASLQGVGPYATWADTANGLLKRRNAAGTDWVVEGALFVNSNAPASESSNGIVTIASTVEAQALVNDLKVLTPKKLADAMKGSNVSFAGSGYQKLPSGLIIQWGQLNSNTTATTHSLPIAFPNAGLQIVISDGGVSTNCQTFAAEFISASQFQALSTFNNTLARYIAIGY